MTTPISPISLGNIQTEFGGSNPISLSAEYYRGGANVPIGTATSATDGVAIPTAASTLIRVGMFRGVTKILPATYSIATAGNVYTFNEGSTITFNVTTTNVPNGTVLSWLLIGGTGFATGDVSDGAPQFQGTVTINSNTGSFTRTIANDATTEGTETFTVAIYTNPGFVWRAETPTISILDTSQASVYVAITDGLNGSGNGGGGGVTATLKPDGTVAYSTRRPIVNTSGAWTTLTGTPGNTHWVRAVLLNEVTGGSGQVGGTFGTWLQLSTNRVWSVEATASGDTESATIRFDISTSATGSPIVYNSTVTWTADNL